jgi:hypothetical protein
MFMVLRSGMKWSGHILAVYLIPAVMGSFIFSAVESLDLFEHTVCQTISDGFYTPIDRAIDWLIDNTAMISGADEYSSSLRCKIPRVLMPACLRNTGVFPLQSLPQTIKQIQCSNIKDTILLKLRI